VTAGGDTQPTTDHDDRRPDLGRHRPTGTTWIESVPTSGSQADQIATAVESATR
jgi:hypothetical protein